jgi:hypothetical protein
MHQPLHSVSQVSSRFPDGDRGGNSQFVRDPRSDQPINLHWYWDDSVGEHGGSDAASQQAADLMNRWPRAQFKQLRSFASAGEFLQWAQESQQIAATIAYGPDLTAGDSAANASKLSARYLEQSKAAAEQRLTLAGYRLTEVLRHAFARPSK